MYPIYSPFYLIYNIKYQILGYHTATAANPIAEFYCVLDLSSNTHLRAKQIYFI